MENDISSFTHKRVYITSATIRCYLF